MLLNIFYMAINLYISSLGELRWPAFQISSIPKWSVDNKFDVRSYYEELRGTNDISFPWKSRWVSFFVWTRDWGNFLPMITSLRGNMCHRSGEKMDIYYSIVMLLIVCGVLHLALLGFTRYYIRKWFWVVELVWEALLGYLNLVPVCLTWLVWKERDSGIYQNTK